MKMAKQFLAALLCLVMVAAVIPAAAPQASAAVGDSIVFNFGGANGAPTGAGVVGTTASNWEIIEKSANLDWTTWGSWKHTQIESPNVGDYVAIKVNISEAGVYSAVANGYDWHSFGKYDIHMFPYTEGMDIAAAIKSFKGYLGYAGKSDTTSGDNYVDEKLYDATLNAGEYVIAYALKGIKWDSNNKQNVQLSGKLYGGLASLTLTKKADLPAASVEVANYEISYYANSTGLWEEMGDLSTVSGSYAWWLEDISASGKTTDDYVTFKLKGLKAGSYKVNAHNNQYWSGCDIDYYLLPASASKDDIAALTTADASYVGQATCNNNAYVNNFNVTTALANSANVPADGDYLLVMKCATGNYSMFARGVELVRYADYVAPEVESVFGNHYAYMTKMGNVCKLTVIGGIKEIDGYSEVGFKVSVNGSVALAKSSKNVYETINYDGAAIDTSKLGEDVEYLFYETFEMNSAELAAVESLSFEAYAVGADGEEYGAAYVLPLN